MPAGEEIRAALTPRLAGPSFLLSGGLCGARRAIHCWKTRRALPPGHPTLHPGQQPWGWPGRPAPPAPPTWVPRPSCGHPSPLAWAPRPFCPRLRTAASGLAWGLSPTPSPEGSKCSGLHLQAMLPSHLPVHSPLTSSVDFGGAPRSSLSSSHPRTLNTSALSSCRNGAYHTLAEKGSHLPPERSGVLGLRALRGPSLSALCPWTSACAPRTQGQGRLVVSRVPFFRLKRSPVRGGGPTRWALHLRPEEYVAVDPDQDPSEFTVSQLLQGASDFLD